MVSHTCLERPQRGGLSNETPSHLASIRTHDAHPILRLFVPPLEAVLLHLLDDFLCLGDGAAEGDHDIKVGETEFLSHQLDSFAFECEAIPIVGIIVSRGASTRGTPIRSQSAVRGGEKETRVPPPKHRILFTGFKVLPS